MLLLLIYTLVFLLLKRKAQFTAGCVLALGLFKFQCILPFVFILLVRRKWSTTAGFGAMAGLLILVSLAISGFQSLGAYPRFLFLDRLNQQVFQPEFMPNIRGIVHLLLNGWVAPWLLQIIVAGLSGGTLWFAAKRWHDGQFNLSFSAAILATLLTSYHFYKYDLTLLLLPVAIACGELAYTKRLLTSPSLLPGVLIILLVHPLHTVLVQQSIYALMSVPVILLFLIIIRLNKPLPEKPVHG